MALRTWQIETIKYCEHVGHEIAMEVEVVYASDIMPEQAPRILSHRCSMALECNMIEKATCAWCGTNPDYKPV